SLTFMNSEEIRKLNREYRNVDEATDVLSFPMIEENQPVGLPELPVLALGDIVICPEETARLHPELEKNEAVYLMIAHSFLHLLGFDHDTDEKQNAMWKKQDAIKDKLIAAMEEK
ncbi:MAG: rRNA maturation RNase YbeY, partial [Synergistaceae bacterium]|nr:rRNA maturation RNase YbeY [Synergistaceae bacterium]